MDPANKYGMGQYSLAIIIKAMGKASISKTVYFSALCTISENILLLQSSIPTTTYIPLNTKI